MKKVSIIITTYKGEKYILRTINSVLKQTYNNYEIIIVDDNGHHTDSQIKTERIIKNIKNDKVIYITHKTNKNGASARNTGLRISSGDYICFLDDDDLILKNRIKKCVEYLDSNTEYDAVFTDVLCANEDLIPTKVIKVRKKGNCNKDIMLNEMFFGTGSNLFLTRKAINKIGYFDNRFLRHQDLEYMIRFYRYFKSSYIPGIEIIKSKNGINNIPKYEKLRKNEEYYISKFNKELSTFSEKEKDIFYNTINLRLNLSKLIYSRFSLKDFIKLSNYEKLLFFVKKYKLDKMKIFKIYNKKRILKKSNYIKLNKYVYNFLKEVTLYD